MLQNVTKNPEKMLQNVTKCYKFKKSLKKIRAKTDQKK